MHFLDKWVPYKLELENNERYCRWLYIGDKKFTEPFFDQTILSCKQLPEYNPAYRVLSSLEMMTAWASNMQSVQPAALIFHVSRCGSTLLSQMLALDEENIVLSEVPVLDELLRLPFAKENSESESTSDAYFQSALRFCGQVRQEKEPRLIIKADSWHLRFYNRLRKLFPDTLFILLYRAPADVIRSQSRGRGMQSVPGVLEPELFGFTEPDITYNLDEYMGRVLTKYFFALHQIISDDSNFILCNYSEGMYSIVNRVFARLAIQPSSEYIERIKERMQFHGKEPSFFYKEEVPEERQPEYLSNAVSLYQELERRRLSIEASFDKVH